MPTQTQPAPAGVCGLPSGDRRSTRHFPTTGTRRWSDGDTKEKRKRWWKAAQAAVFPPVLMGYERFRKACAAAMVVEANALPHGKLRKSILRQAKSLEQCAAHVKVRECQSCGHQRAGSGVMTHHPTSYPCQTRLCAWCGRRRAQKLRHYLSRVLTTVEPRNGMAWRLVTLTCAYDPKSEADVTWEAIRARIVGVQAMFRRVWARCFRDKGAGAFWSVEMAGTGHVHLHALVYARFAAHDHVWKVCKEAYEGAGFPHIKLLGEDATNERVRDAVLEVAKYCTKGASPLSETWVAGRVREVVNPVLAARFVLASAGLHMHQRLGAFRAVKEEEGDALGEAEAEGEEAVVAEEKGKACPCCGSVHPGWQWRVREAVGWVKVCHDAHQKAFHGSRWEPHRDPPDKPVMPPTNRRGWPLGPEPVLVPLGPLPEALA